VAQQQAAENAAIDRTLAYTPYVQYAGAQHREIALTFDDGPGPFTPQVLSVLERENAPATFFEVGSLERYFHASTSQEIANGYPIGDHTETHAPLSHLPAAEQQAQILQQTSKAGAYGAPFPRMFRPPYGLFNSTTLSLLRSYRMLMVLWTIDTEDYKRPGVSLIVRRVLAGARPGAIVLMHDAGASARRQSPPCRRSSPGCGPAATGWSQFRGSCSTTQPRQTSRLTAVSQAAGGRPVASRPRRRDA
jgi:peptidoglycan/xylan/chitin deacetylase (PgdA/CDA1 family)